MTPVRKRREAGGVQPGERDGGAEGDGNCLSGERQPMVPLGIQPEPCVKTDGAETDFCLA